MLISILPNTSVVQLYIPSNILDQHVGLEPVQTKVRTAPTTETDNSCCLESFQCIYIYNSVGGIGAQVAMAGPNAKRARSEMMRLSEGRNCMFSIVFRQCEGLVAKDLPIKCTGLRRESGLEVKGAKNWHICDVSGETVSAVLAIG